AFGGRVLRRRHAGAGGAVRRRVDAGVRVALVVAPMACRGGRDIASSADGPPAAPRLPARGDKGAASWPRSLRRIPEMADRASSAKAVRAAIAFALGLALDRKV